MLRALLVPLILSGLCVVTLAQESSVVELGAPEGPSSGETPEEEAPPPPPPPCGTQPITIARMQWPSAAILAEIHARLLTAHFGCEVRVQMADQAAAGSSMATNGQPAVAPELWITRIAEIWNAGVKAQKLRSAGPTFEDSVFEGWFVPDYVATAQPDVTSMEGLKRHWESFAPSGGKGRFLSCPLDWACSVVNRNLLAAFGLDAFFEVVEPANRFEMDTLIAEAVGRKEPLLFYYWRPNAVLAQFGFKRIDLGPFERDAYQCAGRRVCDTPAPTGFPAEPVVIALAEWVYTEATQVAAYFQRARLPVAEMNAMLEQLGEPGATAETVADRFVAERESVWRAWVGAAP